MRSFLAPLVTVLLDGLYYGNSAEFPVLRVVFKSERSFFNGYFKPRVFSGLGCAYGLARTRYSSARASIGEIRAAR